MLVSFHFIEYGASIIGARHIYSWCYSWWSKIPLFSVQDWFIEYFFFYSDFRWIIFESKIRELTARVSIKTKNKIDVLISEYAYLNPFLTFETNNFVRRKHFFSLWDMCKVSFWPTKLIWITAATMQIGRLDYAMDKWRSYNALSNKK